MSSQLSLLRLRLTIHRNNLSPTNIWWTVRPDDSLTVTDLLSRINDVVPLESPSGWGLEDYVMSLDGSELLHFQPINDILQANDHVECVCSVS